MGLGSGFWGLRFFPCLPPALTTASGGQSAKADVFGKESKGHGLSWGAESPLSLQMFGQRLKDRLAGVFERFSDAE